jgi:hypothetical protein
VIYIQPTINCGTIQLRNPCTADCQLRNPVTADRQLLEPADLRSGTAGTAPADRALETVVVLERLSA